MTEDHQEVNYESDVILNELAKARLNRRKALSTAGKAAIGAAAAIVIGGGAAYWYSTQAPAIKPIVPTTPTPTPTAPTPVAPTPAPPAPAKEVSLFWLVRDYNEAYAKKDLELFYKKFPHIKVRLESQAWVGLFEKLTTLHAGGTGPDAAEGYSPRWMSQFGAAKYLLPLNKYFEKLPDESIPGVAPGKKGFYKGGLEACTIDGELIAIPNRFDGYSIHWNPELFEKAGLPRRAPDTWDEFRDFSIALCKDDPATGKRIQWGVGTMFLDEVFTEHPIPGRVWGYGGDFVSEDLKKSTATDPIVVDAYQDMIDLHLKKGAWWPPSITAAFGDVCAAFAKNQIGIMFTVTTWGLANILKFKADMKMGLAPMPKGPVARWSAISGAVWAIARTSKNPDEAWELIKFMAEPSENMPKYTVSWVAHEDAAKHAKYDAFRRDPLLSYGIEGQGGAKHAWGAARVFKLKNYFGVAVAYGKAFKACWEGKDVKSTLATADEEVNRLLKG